jgi:tRNA A-37 threonylcarbamoyl transferase component Bud32
MENLTGKQFGPYQIVAPLGEGGMAAVYKAYQPGMERYVALKVLPRSYADDPQFLARFQREAKLLAQLQHPHILPVFDFGQAESYTYIVMPFIQSGTLTDQLKGSPISLPRIRQVITQVGEALAYAHGRGLIHRDIKPSNILIDESGNCLLTDFGLARMVEDAVNLTSTGTIMGTPAYMSPEQGSGQKIDARSDIYSLGVVLFEMATGRVPYRAETPIAVVFKHVQDPLPPARSINPDLPEAVELVILKSLAKNPEDRYQTAGDLVRAIQGAIPESHVSTAAAAATIAQKPVAAQAPASAKEGSAVSKPAEEQAPPAATMVEEGMAPTMMAQPKKRSGMPAWVWAVVGVVLLMVIAGGGFALFGRGAAIAPTPTVAPVAAALTQKAAITSAPTVAPVAAALTQKAATASAPTVAPVAAALTKQAAAPSNVLIAVGTLYPGDQMLSGNKLYRFEVQTGGELVLYDNYTDKMLWSSFSTGDPEALVLQDDGNLVLYAKNGSVIWASDKIGKQGDYFLGLQDDGNLVVYQGKNNTPNIKPIWATNTAR